MKKLIKISASIILILNGLFYISCEDNICVQGTGEIITKELDVPEISGIDLAIAADVVISQGQSQVITATGHQNIIDKLKSNVSGNDWIIELDKSCYSEYELTIYVTVPNIENISLSGTGSITVNDFTGQDDLNLHLSGSGDIFLGTFDGCENLAVDIGGVGTVKGEGTFADLKNLDIDIRGSGDFDGYPLITDACKINIPGSGNCYVHVVNTLDITISGAGNVFYLGDPQISQNISGSGSVNNEN